MEKHEGQLVGLCFSPFLPFFFCQTMVLRTWGIPTITVEDARFDGWVKYQDLMNGIILSCELTEGRECVLLSCMGQL